MGPCGDLNKPGQMREMSTATGLPAKLKLTQSCSQSPEYFPIASCSASVAAAHSEVWVMAALTGIVQVKITFRICSLSSCMGSRTAIKWLPLEATGASRMKLRPLLDCYFWPSFSSFLVFSLVSLFIFQKLFLATASISVHAFQLRLQFLCPWLSSSLLEINK